MRVVKQSRCMRTLVEKRGIVEETLRPGVSVSTVARRHEVNANLVFGGRRLYQQGLLEPDAVINVPRLLPVQISAPSATPIHTAPTSGAITITLANGHRIELHAPIDALARSRQCLISCGSDADVHGRTRVWLVAGVTDMRKGFDGLAVLVQTQGSEESFSGQLFVFRGRRGDRVKLLWWDGDGFVPVRQAPGTGPLRLAARPGPSGSSHAGNTPFRPGSPVIGQG